jgi:phosphoglucosamine mutase
MTRLFGTDGVRGVANQDLTPDLALALGRAAGEVLAPNGEAVVVGRDTRISGPMLEGALAAGLSSAGARVRLAGVIPTPAVAYLTIHEGAAAGAMISASHNPVPDNGIKFFSPDGMKLSEGLEDRIEAAMERGPSDLPTGLRVGASEWIEEAHDRYVDHLLATLPERLTGLRIVLDCAFGSAWKVGPRAFREAGADVVAINAEPDGTRINVDCGSTSLDGLAKRVLEEGADLGLGFDGDADRVLAVDEQGAALDGDRILTVLARGLHEAGQLKEDLVVATVMSNLGFLRAMRDRGIEVVTAPVGDKYVVEEMVARGAILGGEQSGHVILAEHSSTGDGILTGLQVAAFLVASDRPLSDVSRGWERFPQILVNVPVEGRVQLEGAEPVWAEVRAVEAELGDGGRVLLRASGTEPVVRVMVEAENENRARAAAERLAGSVAAHLQRS